MNQSGDQSTKKTFDWNFFIAIIAVAISFLASYKDIAAAVSGFFSKNEKFIGKYECYTVDCLANGKGRQIFKDGDQIKCESKAGIVQARFDGDKIVCWNYVGTLTNWGIRWSDGAGWFKYE